MSRKILPVNKIATFDFETDPFMYGRVPVPFVAGFYSEEIGFKYFWSDDPVPELLQFLDDLKEPHKIYAHNGGKFDFFLMLEHLENPIKIIGGRIVQARVGIHTLQDSYAIIPIALKQFDKDDIDYAKLEAEVRNQHRPEIIKYLEKDCTSLHKLVTAFNARFGDQLTVGATAMKELKKLHPFVNQKKSHDDYFRKWYFGGRVEAFETGIIKGQFFDYDVNSMYPHVMRDVQHPTGSGYKKISGAKLDKRHRIRGIKPDVPFFIALECDQQGAFPVRQKMEPLDFNCPHGIFHTTSHEFYAAIDTGRIQNINILELIVPTDTINFTDYVDKFSREKIEAKASGDKITEIFSKFLLNSAYGKFGQNPANYFDYKIVGVGEENPDGDWEAFYVEVGQPSIWRTPSASQVYHDVATAASITGAARAVLMRALSRAIRPLYCDTDAIVAASLDVPLHDFDLGKWKIECEADTCAIAGKKLYALRLGKEYVKIASKGAVLTGPEIFSICRGSEIHWHNQAPSFSLSRGVNFTDRRIKIRA